MTGLSSLSHRIIMSEIFHAALGLIVVILTALLVTGAFIFCAFCYYYIRGYAVYQFSKDTDSAGDYVLVNSNLAGPPSLSGIDRNATVLKSFLVSNLRVLQARVDDNGQSGAEVLKVTSADEAGGDVLLAPARPAWLTESPSGGTGS
ncbi:hypothetical protein MD484_g5057, partial [Candolleomyces efflorescens]